MKHKVKINVTDEKGSKQTILKSGIRTLPKKLLAWLLGEDMDILVLTPSKLVQSVEIHEVKEEKNQMSQTKRWLDVVEDLRHLADSLEFLIAGMTNDEVPTQQAKKLKTDKTKIPKVTLEQVRGTLASKSQEGKTAEVRELIQKYGASKLSEVDEKHFADLLKEAEEL